MIRPFALAVLALALPLTAVAQPAPRPAPPDVPARITALGVAATPAQQTRLDAIAARYAGQTDAAALWAASAEIGALLTPEQTAALASARRARPDGARSDGARGRRGDARRSDRPRPDGARPDRRGGARRGSAAGPDRTAARAVRSEFAPRVRALRERRAAGQVTEAEFAEQSRALRADVETRLDALRTPEQRQRLADARARRDAAEAARVRALGLTDAQQEALRALRPARGTARGTADGAARGDRRAQAEAVLTPQQRATLAVHAALARRGPGRRTAE